MTSASEEPEDIVLFASLQKLLPPPPQILHHLASVLVLWQLFKLLPLDPTVLVSLQLMQLLLQMLVLETIWRLSVFRMVLVRPLQQELQPPSLESVEHSGMQQLPQIRSPMLQPAPMPLHSKL